MSEIDMRAYTLQNATCSLVQAPYFRKPPVAIYHFTSKVIGRSTRNTVAAIAYRTGTELTCARTGLTSDYSEKTVEHVELLCHEDVPNWVHDLQAEIAQNRESGVQRFSDICELAEKRLDAQVYRECEFALPHELSDEQNYELAREFIHYQFTKKGMLALASFHMDIDSNTGQKKPHCHLLLSMREATESGFSPHKNRRWNSKDLLLEWRESWALHVNAYLKNKGLESVIDHRSYKDQCLDLEPQIKRGRNIQEMHNKGMVVEKMQEWDAIRIRNLYRIISKPEVILDIVTKQKAVFSMKDIRKVLFRYVDDQILFDRLCTKIQTSSEMIVLGEGRYTTQGMLRLETSLMKIAHDLSDKTHEDTKCLTPSSGLTQKLSLPQREALNDILSPQQMKTLVGYAGSGKTRLLSQAAHIWKNQGIHVVGLAPTGKAADNLQQLGIPSFTLHKFLKDYANGRAQYNPRTVLILDEAGMVDTSRFYKFLKAVDHLGAKTVLVGDQGQLQAIEAGDAFRLISQVTNPYILSEVRRQKVAWQKKATQLLGCGDSKQALLLYSQHNCIQLHDYQDEGMREFLASWIQSMLHHPQHTHTMLAHTNKDVERLNKKARTLLKACEMLDQHDHTFTTIKLQEDDWGKLQIIKTNKAFSRGDRIVFTRNDNGLGVKNGMMGKIISLNKQKITVALEHSQDTISFAPNLYPYFDQGWATSIHKSQGSTFDHVFVWASEGMYHNLTYVAFTRHKESLHVYSDKETFKDQADLIHKLSRVQDKASSLDHISMEEAEQLMKQDEQILRPIFEKLQNHLEAIGFVTGEAFAHVRDKYFLHPDSQMQKSGIIKHYDEQTQTYSSAKDLVGLRGSAQLDKTSSQELVESPLSVLHSLNRDEYQSLAEMYCKQHYGFTQVDVYDEDKLRFVRFIQNAKALKQKEAHTLPTLLKAHEESIQVTAQNLQEHEGLSQELAHIAATSIHDHELHHQTHLSDAQKRAFIDHMKAYEDEYHQHAQKVSGLLKEHGSHIHNQAEYRAYQEELARHYSLQIASHNLHHICHPHELRRDVHQGVHNRIEQHLQHMIHQQGREQLELGKARGVGMEI